MKFSPRFSFFTFLISGILAFSSAQNVLADIVLPANDNTVMMQPAADFFVPLDSLPDFYDFHEIAWQHIEDFDSVLSSFPKSAFYDVPDVAGKALSDHLITWSEFAQCLNSAGTIYSSNQPDVTPHHLWSSEMQPYITRKVVSQQIPGSPFSTKIFAYDVVPEHANEVAMLSVATAQRYVNWRNVHFWLYHQLQREEAVLKQQTIARESDDRITAYFRQKNLYPPIDPVNNIDHIDEILNQSTEIGCYWFSEKGDIVKSIDLNAAFSLPATTSKKAWDVRYAEQFPFQENIWLAESASSNNETQTGAIQLAVNKDTMMQGKNMAAEEACLQQAVQSIQQNFTLLKSNAAYQQADEKEQALLEKIFFDVSAIGLCIWSIPDLFFYFDMQLSEKYCFQRVLQLVQENYFTNDELRSAGFSPEDISNMDRVFRLNRRHGYYQNHIEWLRDRYYRNQTAKALAKIGCAALAFYFGNSSNIDCNY